MEGYRVIVREIPGGHGGGTMIVAADEEIVGRVFYEESKGIRLEVPHSLASGERVGDERMIELLFAGDVLILYGPRLVSLAIQMGLAHEDSVLYVEGVPHVQVFKFRIG